MRKQKNQILKKKHSQSCIQDPTSSPVSNFGMNGGDLVQNAYPVSNVGHAVQVKKLSQKNLSLSEMNETTTDVLPQKD